MLRPHQTATFSKRSPTKSSAWVFLRHVTLLAIVIGHRATPKKCGVVKYKLFPDFISRRGTAQRGAARRSSQCSPCNDKQYSLCFFRRLAAFGGAVALVRFISSINHSYDELNDCLNIKMSKCLVSN